jgi:hypothetical protein
MCLRHRLGIAALTPTYAADGYGTPCLYGSVTDGEEH